MAEFGSRQYVGRLKSQDSPDTSLRFAVQRVCPAARAELIQFYAPRIITAIFFGGVIPFFTLRTCQRDHRAYTFFTSHIFSFKPLRSAPDSPLLLDNLGDHASANRETTFSDGEIRALLQRHRHDQLYLQVHTVSWHHHLYAFRQLDISRHI